MMHFDESGKYMRSTEMDNNNLRVKTDHVSNYSNGACKKLCLQYLAQKPSIYKILGSLVSLVIAGIINLEITITSKDGSIIIKPEPHIIGILSVTVN